MANPLKTYRVSLGQRIILRGVVPIVCAAIVIGGAQGAGLFVWVLGVILAAPMAVGFWRWGRNRIDIYPDRVVVTRAFKTYVRSITDIVDVTCGQAGMWRVICFDTNAGEHIRSRAISGKQTFYPDAEFDAKLAEVRTEVNRLKSGELPVEAPATGVS